MRMAGVGLLLAAMVHWLPAPGAYGMQLALVGERPERVLACLPIAAEQPFHLEFVNSIYLTRVRESFTGDPEKGISLIGVESPSYGVFEYYGLVRDASGKSSVRRHIGELRLRSHDYGSHVLIVGERHVHLHQFVGGGRSLILRVVDEAHCRPAQTNRSR